MLFCRWIAYVLLIMSNRVNLIKRYDRGEILLNWLENVSESTFRSPRYLPTILGPLTIKKEGPSFICLTLPFSSSKRKNDCVFIYETRINLRMRGSLRKRFSVFIVLGCNVAPGDRRESQQCTHRIPYIPGLLSEWINPNRAYLL